MTMRETRIERHLRDRVKALGGVAFKFQSATMSGVPDRIVILPSRIIFCELKATGKKPRPLQVYVATIIRQLGFEVRFLDSIEQVNELLEGL